MNGDNDSREDLDDDSFLQEGDMEEVDDNEFHAVDYTEEEEDIDIDPQEEGGERIIIEETEPVIDMATVVFSGHNDSVYCIAVHPLDPSLIITGGGDDKGFLWRFDTEDHRIVDQIELSGHSDTVTSVGFNFNGLLMLTGSYDGSIQIWRIMDRKDKLNVSKVLLIGDGPEDIEWATWHPKGNCVVAGSKDSTVWMWLVTHNSSDEYQSQCIQVFAGHEGEVTCGDFTADGKHVVTGSVDGTVRIWNPKNGVCKGVLSFVSSSDRSEEEEEEEVIVTCVVSNLDGELILAGELHYHYYYQVVTGP